MIVYITFSLLVISLLIGGGLRWSRSKNSVLQRLSIAVLGVSVFLVGLCFYQRSWPLASFLSPMLFIFGAQITLWAVGISSEVLGNTPSFPVDHQVLEERREALASRSGPDRYYHLEIMTFRVCMWATVAGSFGAIATKAVWHRPSDVSVQSFLVLAMVAAVLAAFGPSLGSYAVSRLQKISFAGFAVELSADVGLAVEYLVNEGVPPSDVASDHPFAMKPLTGPQAYHYEKLSHRLYLIFPQVRDPSKLDFETREKLRKLIVFVGTAAQAMKHYTKSLDILLWLRRFSDKDLNYRELSLLASAYLWATDEQPDECRGYQEQAAALSNIALKNYPYGVEAAYHLGWALLSLGDYDDGIEMMRKCIKFQVDYAHWANWNIACGLKKLGKDDEALQTLKEIPPVRLWQDIVNDDWFEDSQKPEFVDRFKKLCQSKIEEYNSKTAATENLGL